MHYQLGVNLEYTHLPQTERVSKEVVSLLLYPELAEDQVEFVVESIRSFYKDMGKD